MKLTKQEKLIKNKMQSFEHQLDTGELWQSLAQHVPEKENKKRRGVYFVLFTIIILIGMMTIGGYLYINSTGKKPDNNLTKITPDNIQKETDKSINITKKKTKLIPQLSLNENISSSENHKSIKNNTNTKTSSNKINQVKNTEKNKQNKDINRINTEQYNTKNTKAIQNNTILSSDNNKEINRNIPIKQDKLSKKEYVYFHRVKNSGLLPVNRNKPQLTVQTANNSSSFLKKKMILHLGISSGGFNHGFYYKKKSEKNYTEYINKIYASKPVLGINIGADYYFYKRFYINSGLFFSRLVTQLQNIEEKKVTVTETTAALITTKDNKYKITTYNYHYLVDMPVIIGFELVQGKTYKISFEAGAIFNLYTYSEGRYINEQYLLNRYTNTKNNPYGNRFNTGWKTSILFDFKPAKGQWFYIKSGICTKTIDYSINNYINLKEYFKILDLNVGIKYIL